jgi:hypothetical protein
MNFMTLKTAVARQFERMQKHTMFRVDIDDKNVLWDLYISSFPPGTNELFRKRTEHDCSCCKQFIRSIGDVVAIIDGKIETLWGLDGSKMEDGYRIVAEHLDALVRSKPIKEPFLHYERHAGTDKTFENLLDGAKSWSHFHVNIESKFVAAKDSIPTRLSGLRADHDVLARSLNEITLDSIDTVLDLIAQNSLYKGQENKHAVSEFRKLKIRPAAEHALLAWTAGAIGSVARIRNTSIGTLLVDLSEGVELDAAVKKFEAMVAPANYKRPTALITQGMITKAKEKLAELGLTSALERRYAVLDDITINNVLFADRSTKKALSGDVFDTLTSQVSAKSKSLDKVEEVPIEKFLAEIMPKADSIEVMFENAHASNLVSLIAPVDPTAGELFKWPNRFSWSYNGEMADSIKERVKAAGGNVTGELCCRLAWDYADDLDFHMIEPNGHRIYYGHRGQHSPNGGMLDVDANGMDGQRANPVENIFYSKLSRMREGSYALEVNNFSRRSDGVGFEVEIDIQGTVHRMGYAKVLKSKDTIKIAELRYTKAKGIEIISSLPSSAAVRTIWGIPTNTFHKVNVMMMSPNFWDDKAVGSKHYFFMLDKCVNDGTARGFFNEFLKSELDAHRKTLEVVGSKMKITEGAEQLSGLGFSSTQRNTLICRVKGSFTRTIKIVF